MRHEVVLSAVIAGLLLASAVALAAPAVAQEEGPAEIAIDNFLFLRIRTPAAGFKIEERRLLLEKRLVEICSTENTGHPDVRVGNIRGKPTIYVGKVQLITVYPRDANANKTTMKKLAAQWAERIRMGLKKIGPARYAEPGAPEGEAAVTENAPPA